MIDTGTDIDTQMPTTSGKFTDLRSAIAKAVAESVPPDKHTAVFAIGEKTSASDAGTFRFGLAHKIGETWQIEGDLAADGKGKHVTGRVMVAGTW